MRSRANLTGCVPASSFTADPNRSYYDWSLTPMGTPEMRVSNGREKTPVWKGLPWPVAMLCTSCGGGAQLADGSYVYLAVTQFNRTWELADHSKRAPCCNNSVVSFTSPDALTWTYSATVGDFPRQMIYAAYMYSLIAFNAKVNRVQGPMTSGGSIKKAPMSAMSCC